MKQSASLYERVIERPRPLWVKIVVCLFLFALPFAVVYLGDSAAEFIANGNWRFLLLSPSIIIYIWLGSPLLDRFNKEVIYSLRSISALDDESFSRLMAETHYVNPRNELIAIGIGAVVGLALNSANDYTDTSVLFGVYWTLSMLAMYALLAWMIYLAVIGSRSNGVLLQQPLRINLFNPAPFEAIGRQSLLLALMFIGGLTLSLVFSFRWENLSHPLFWLVYMSLVLVTLLIFFASMRPAHRLLAKEKEKELTQVRRNLEWLGRELMLRMENRQDAGKIAAEFNALSAYEGRVLAARTWPYNTIMLRTLFFSFLVPLGSFLVKTAIDLVLP
jgi:hypothetical protein